MSMSVLESLASGVPVICSDHPGNSEIIEDGINGFVFKNKSDAECLLTELCLNPDLLANLKKTTKKHFNEHLDAKIMASRYMKLFEDISGRWTKGLKSKFKTIDERIPIRKRKKTGLRCSGTNWQVCNHQAI